LLCSTVVSSSSCFSRAIFFNIKFRCVLPIFENLCTSTAGPRARRRVNAELWSLVFSKN
jgi:hypothetical protein